MNIWELREYQPHFGFFKSPVLLRRIWTRNTHQVLVGRIRARARVSGGGQTNLGMDTGASGWPQLLYLCAHHLLEECWQQWLRDWDNHTQEALSTPSGEGWCSVVHGAFDFFPFSTEECFHFQLECCFWKMGSYIGQVSLCDSTEISVKLSIKLHHEHLAPGYCPVSSRLMQLSVMPGWVLRVFLWKAWWPYHQGPSLRVCPKLDSNLLKGWDWGVCVFSF